MQVTQCPTRFAYGYRPNHYEIGIFKPCTQKYVIDDEMKRLRKKRKSK